MNEEDFPSLYLDANTVSMRAQKNFIRANLGVIVGSVIIGALGMVDDFPPVVIVQIVLGIVVVVGSLYLLFGKPQTIWYSTRALAESIKTISWKYVSRAEPFNVSTVESSVKFRSMVSEILRANDEAKALRFESAHTDLITESMVQIRESNLDSRKGIYLTDRVDDQLKWYKRKSSWNDLRSKGWYTGLIFISLIVLSISFAKLRYNFEVSVDWMFSIPIAVLGWIQLKRFQELASSYSLTAHEIVFAKNELAQVNREDQFSDFVGNTENAFSREHTQWFARKDLGY